MRRAAFATFVRLLVTATAAWLVLRNTDLADVGVRFGAAAAGRLALAFIVLTAQFLVMTWRWQILTRYLANASVAFDVLAQSLGRSMLIGTVLPTMLGGDLVRTALLSRSVGLDGAARSVACDRLLGLFSLFVLVTITLPAFAWRVDNRLASISLALLSLAGLGVFSATLLYSRWSALPWLGRFVGPLVADLRRAATGRIGALAFVLAIAMHLLGILLVFLLAGALGACISFVDCFIVVPPLVLVAALPVSLGGWGVREGAFAAGFGLVGISPGIGLATSALFGISGPLLGLAAEITVPLARLRTGRMRRE